MAQPNPATHQLLPAVLLPVRTVPGILSTFSGEDPIAGAAAAVPGSGWYHELITRDGAVAAGWQGPGGPGTAAGSTAADALAWHADYVDSYLYNPLWWFGPTSGGGPARLGAALMARSELIKLHFDDLASTVQIRRMWQRYLGGTVAALVWAAEHDDIHAARNAIGCGLHAMQDFYSHSTWVDAGGRRTLTWFEAATPVRPWLLRWPGTAPVRDLALAALAAAGPDGPRRSDDPGDRPRSPPRLGAEHGHLRAGSAARGACARQVRLRLHGAVAPAFRAARRRRAAPVVRRP